MPGHPCKREGGWRREREWAKKEIEEGGGGGKWEGDEGEGERGRWEEEGGGERHRDKVGVVFIEAIYA